MKLPLKHRWRGHLVHHSTNYFWAFNVRNKFISEDIGYVVGGSGVDKTTDGGGTWEENLRQ